MSTKVYEGNGWKVINGRWQDSPPEQVDHVISDPPYSEKTHKGGVRGGTDRSEYKGGVRAFGGFSFDPIDPRDFAADLVARARRWVLCFCELEQIALYKDATGEAWVRAGIWVNPNRQPQFSGDRPGMACDGIAIMHRKGLKRWNGGGLPAKWEYRHPSERIHETEKPLDLMIDIVEKFTDPGDLIWDPYGGSMTTGVACLMLGRRFLGHEMQERYAEVGAERLRAAEQGLTLTAARAGQLPLFGGTK